MSYDPGIEFMRITGQSRGLLFIRRVARTVEGFLIMTVMLLLHQTTAHIARRTGTGSGKNSAETWAVIFP